MSTLDLPDIRNAHALRPAVNGFENIYQANPLCPCYNYYMYYQEFIVVRRLLKYQVDYEK